jgi:hypothetical protein
MNEEESVEDPLFIQGETNSDVGDYIVTEIKREGIDDDSLCVTEIHHSGDEENRIEIHIV